jgi:hypothetical protein
MEPTASRSRWRAIAYALGGIALLVILSCAGLVIWGRGVMGELREAQAAADSFLDAIRDGRIDAAYAETAPAFRSHVTPERFKALVEQFPAFREQSRRSYGGMRVSYNTGTGKRAHLQVNLVGPNNTLSMFLVLAKVDKRWAVESVNLP